MTRTFPRVIAAISLGLLAACGGSSGGTPLSGPSDAASTPPSAAASAPASAEAASPAIDSITVGSANFPENVLLAEIYAGALEAKGVKVTKKLNIGSREVYIPALKDGSIDLLPEYTGTLLSYFDKGTSTATSPDDVYKALVAALPPGISALKPSEAEDKDTLAVTKKTAATRKLTSISDLTPIAGQLKIGAGPEFKSRQTGLLGLKRVYGLTFKEFKPMDPGGVLTIKGLSDGTVDVANIFSTDSSIKTKGFVVLADPKNLFLAENVVPVINAKKLSPTVTDALNAVSAKLNTANLTDLVSKVQVDKQDPVKVAAAFLKSSGLA